MKGKHAGYIIFIALFFLICCIPSAGMLFSQQAQPAANEILAEPPAMFDQTGRLNLNVCQDLTDYVADRFAYRQEMVTINAFLKAKLLHQSAAEDVLLGKEDWLFYEETKADYLRSDVLSQRQIDGIARTLKLLQDACEAEGKQFLFMVATNKNSLYPQYMPDVGTPLAKEKNLTLLKEALDRQSVNWLDLEQAFLDQGEILYFHTDSHWNNKGAAFVRDLILQKLDLWDGVWYSRLPYTTEATHRGDLYEMLYPKGTGLEEDVHFEMAFTFSDKDGQTAADRMRIQTSCAGKTGSLVMFRDSFGNSLYPFLAESFGECTFSRKIPYDMTLIRESGAQVVIAEIVERNIDWLCQYAPVLEAPEVYLDQRELESAGEAGGDARAVITVEQESAFSGYVKISGTYQGAGDHQQILIETDGGLYEAFPVGDVETPDCFTAYIPQEKIVGQECNILVGSHGRWTRINGMIEKI